MRHQSGNDTTQLRRRLEECPTLPTLPAIAMELLDHLGDPDLDLETTATLIQRDPALAASVLRFVNSPYWGVSKEVKSLAHAIALLGINAIHTLALSFSLVRGLKDNPNNSFDFDHYWRKSILTGALARAFGVSRGVLNLEQLFLAGLLQDIGMLALQSLLPEAYGEMSKSAANNHSRLCQLEREALGVDHAHVGAWLAELWGLPEGYLLAIRESHDFDLETVPAALRDEVECVFLAGCLADIWLNPDSRDEDIWKKLLSHTNETTLESITADVQEWFSKLSHLFRVPVLDSARADQVLLEAREQLAEVSLRNLQRTEQIERERQRLAAHNLELRKRTFRDALTGLYNRAYLEDIVTESYRGLAATKGHISVLFCDVNRFKDFNDTYGHKCGDEILAAVGQAISNLIRPDDKAIRFGGDEFLLILPGANAALAANIAKRLCAAVADVQIQVESGQQLSVSISAGSATHSADSPYDSIEALCNAADFELYRVKRSREEGCPRETTENRMAS